MINETQNTEPRTTVQSKLWINGSVKNTTPKKRQKIINPSDRNNSVETGWYQSEHSRLRLFFEHYGFTFEDIPSEGISDKIAGIPVVFEENNTIIIYESATQSEAYEKFHRPDGIKDELDRQKLRVIEHECPEIITMVKPKSCNSYSTNIVNPKYNNKA